MRFSWGGGTAQTWSGTISATDGTFSNASPLGLGVDSSASVKLTGGKLVIDHWSPTNYGGVDVNLSTSPDTQVTFSLFADETPETKFEQTTTLSELIDQTTGGSIDPLGNRFSVTRVPGNAIDVSFSRDHLVFKPNEPFKFQITPLLTGFQTKSASCKIRMWPANLANKPISRPLFSKTASFELDALGSADGQTVNLNMPKTEGIYNLEIELDPTWYQSSFNVKKNSLRRKIQFIVLSDKPASTTEGTKRRWRQVSIVDPVNVDSNSLPASWSRVVGLPANRTIGNQLRSPVVIDQQTLMQLAPGGWQAIPLTIDRLNKPHVVELDYVSTGEMSLGLSLLQTDAAGQIPLYGFDSGVFIPKSLVTDSNAGKIQRHRLTIWPKTKNPYLLVANRHAGKNAVVGKVRVFAGPDRLERSQVAKTPVGSGAAAKRKLMAFYEAPLFPENFGAREKTDPSMREPLDDWRMFYEGANRFIEYLQANSYRGAFVTVACDGSAIYPSKLLSPSPKHDNGTFFSTGQDPIRKDILEMLFRMFEREGLVLVPTLAMSGPLPEIESERTAPTRPSDDPNSIAQSQSFEMVDVNQEVHSRAISGGLPIYNPLDRKVQRSVTRVVDELAERYKRHSAFDGVAIICRPDTYTLLPGRRWGYDPTTVQQFFQSLPELGAVPTQWADIQALLLGKQRKTWVDWRANQMALWYEDMAANVRRSLPNGKLYLAPVDIYRNEETASALSPGLHGSSDFEQVMLHMGLSSRTLAGIDEEGRENGIVLLNPHRLSPDQPLSSRRIDIAVENSKQAEQFFAQSSYAGDLFTHRISWAHFAQLQAQSPFGNQLSPLMRLQQMAPAEHFNRRRFVESIRNRDARMLIDGGWMVTIGQESSILDMMTVYGNLPDQKFEDVTNHYKNPRSLPLAVRQIRTPEESTFYVANASPWPMNVKLYFDVGDSSTPKVESLSAHSLEVKKSAPVSIQQASSSTGKSANASLNQTGEVNGQKNRGAYEIRLTVPAYGLVGGRSTNQGFSLNDFEFRLPDNADRDLRRHVYSLQSKLAKSNNTRHAGVIENPSFMLGGQSTFGGWDKGEQPTTKIRLGTESEVRVAPTQNGNPKLNGQSNPPTDGVSLIMTNTDPEPVWIRSNSFKAPETGRLSISVWLKTDDAKKQPPVRLAVEGQLPGQSPNTSYYRFGSVGSLSPDPDSNQVGEEWKRFAVHFDDLPTEGLTHVRIGFDLMGPGKVQVDNVQVFDRWFDEKDAKAITQLLASTGPLLSQPESWDRCRRLLNGYWCKFLDEHLSEEEPPANKKASQSSSQTDTQPRNTQSRLRPLNTLPLQPINNEFPPATEREMESTGKRKPSKFRRFRNLGTPRKK
ncbi:MAG: family 10 glycosylhydrolase [Mariniblastus sp.]